ncbi:MAG: trypsin-like peptidase domain-containing protein [Planctomycetes bacterium]|nr:trypsin-like peptidase domain-containing protein [Planctomycetota bacterium]
MLTRTTSAIAFAALLTVGVAGGIALQKGLGWGALAAQERVEVPASAKQLQEAFNRAAEFATKSVVHITTEARPEPEDWFWGLQAPAQNIGSGVIVSADGHILTNHHVIDGFRAGLVRFGDGREFRAELVGDDPESDLALLKIEAAGVKLQPLPFADSDKVRVGDWVLAIGSPFGYSHSVSAGIISAKHRRTARGLPYQDYLQTDAAINPGNSGGALVNLSGELVGINTAIVSQSRAFEGIGLAISSNLAAWVRDRLLKDGRVRRGYLGVGVADLDQNLVESLREDGIRRLEDLLADVGLEEPTGAFITQVTAGEAAAKAGLRYGDVIIEFDAKKIRSLQELLFRVAECEPGRKVTAKVLRNRKLRDVEIEVGEKPRRTR